MSMDYSPNFSSIWLAFGAVVVGLVMLVSGGESLVSGAVRLARRWGVSPLVIGLTVVAFGTSVPELFVSLTAALQGHPDIMIGNVVGSNIANIGLILGFCALIVPLHLTLREVWNELLLVLGGSILLMLCSAYGFFPRSVGLIFIVTLLGYTTLTYYRKSGRIPEELLSESDSRAAAQPVLVPILLVIGGLILLGSGSSLFINGAVDVARYFRVSELIIGLTLAAIGTSLPELASSLSALRRKESGMLIGNVIGSNMFNLFMDLGLTAVIKPFALSRDLLHRDLPIMLSFTLILIPILQRNGGTNRWHGLLFLLGYAGYCLALL